MGNWGYKRICNWQWPIFLESRIEASIEAVPYSVGSMITTSQVIHWIFVPAFRGEGTFAFLLPESVFQRIFQPRGFLCVTNIAYIAYIPLLCFLEARLTWARPPSAL